MGNSHANTHWETEILSQLLSHLFHEIVVASWQASHAEYKLFVVAECELIQRAKGNLGPPIYYSVATTFEALRVSCSGWCVHSTWVERAQCVGVWGDTT